MIKFSAILNSLILVSVIALCMTITFLQSEGHWSSENVGNEGALMSNLSMDPETKPDFQGMELTVFTRKMIDEFTSAFNWSFSISETDHLGVIVLDYEGVSFIIFSVKSQCFQFFFRNSTVLKHVSQFYRLSQNPDPDPRLLRKKSTRVNLQLMMTKNLFSILHISILRLLSFLTDRMKIVFLQMSV